MNLIIGLGNAGTQVVKLAAKSKRLDDVKMYAIDSVTSSLDMASIAAIKPIPIISDDKSGSGRNRERGRAMFEYHDSNGAFDELYKDATEAKSPVIVITSAAGGTGSGSTPALIKRLLGMDVTVIPIIICPSMSDPDTFHMNAMDLMVELGEMGVLTYSIFRNAERGVDYDPINKDIVNVIEIVFGKRYNNLTNRDTIDDSDLDSLFDIPGRFIALTVEASDINTLKKELIRKVLTGYQPAWTPEEAENTTIARAYSLTSMFASKDYDDVFEELNARMGSGRFEEFKNVTDDDNNGVCVATVIVTGLPHAAMKEVTGDFKTADGIAAGMKKSTRPSFMNAKKASITKANPKDGNARSKFNWKK